MTSLTTLQVGERAIISGYSKQGKAIRPKLLAMGLTRGTEVCLKRTAPLGDPVELEVRGFHLSLRKDEAAILFVEKKE